jgi:hypothetical protein
MIAFEQGNERRHARRRMRPVTDVFARVRGLVHVGPHVSRVHPVDLEIGKLGREDGADLFER